MNKLSKEKRDKLILIGAGTLVVIGLLWYMLIGAQKIALAKVQESTENAQDKLEKAEARLKGAGRVQAQLAEIRGKLAEFENRMIPTEQLTGNKWLLDTLTEFVRSNRFDVRPTAMSKDPIIGKQFLILPNFDYSAAEYIVEVHAYYHEFGKFLAALESHFPFFHLQSLQITPLATSPVKTTATADQPEGALSKADQERLNISMKLVLLFKPAGLR